MSFGRDDVCHRYHQADAEIKAKASRFSNPFTTAFSYLFGEIAARLVLQSQSPAEKFRFEQALIKNNPKYEIQDFNESQRQSESAEILWRQEFKVGTQELDTISICYGEANNTFEPPQPETHIIHFCANSETYQDTTRIKELMKMARVTGANVISFNYPGAGLSKGATSSRDDLINAGIAQVERLLEEGVDPAKITLTGTSLGGAVSTMVAKHFNDRGVQLNLFNKQSFANLTDVVVGNVRTGSFFDVNAGSGRDAGFFRKMLGYVIKPIVKLFMVATKFEMDVAGAYRSLPDERKSYSVAKTPLSERWQRLQENETVKEALELVGMNVPGGNEFTKSQKHAILSDARKRIAAEVKQHQVYLKSVMNEIEKNNNKVLDPRDPEANQPLLEYDSRLSQIKNNTEEKIAKLQTAMALIMPKDDGTITSYGSLHRALKIDRKSKKTEDSHHKVYHQDDAGKNVHMHSSDSLTRVGDKRTLSDVFLNFHRKVTGGADVKSPKKNPEISDHKNNQPK